MTFKTWEKIYWGIWGVIFGLYTLVASLPLFGDEDKIKSTIQGQDYYYTKATYFGYLLLGIGIFVVFFGLIWLVIRLIVNKGWEDKKKG